MKNLYVLILGLLIVLTGCKKGGTDDSTSNGISGCTDKNSINYNPFATIDDGSCKYPGQQQRALILEYTSTTCHYCGEWGHDTFESLITTYPGKVVPICIHHYLNSPGDDIMEVPALHKSFANERPSGSPKIDINEYCNLTYGQFHPLVARLTKDPATIGVQSSSSISGDTMTVRATVKFFDNPDGTTWFGEYYVNVYVLESGISGYNNGPYNQSTDHPRPDYTHDFTLRTAANPTSAYGYLLAAGTANDPIKENSTVSKTFKIKLNSGWNRSKLNTAVVVWLDLGNRHKYINGYFE